MKVYIETLGCPKNFNDSQVAAGLLEKGGHRVTNDIASADAVMLNTCGFINDAKKESIERILELAEYRSEGKVLIVSHGFGSSKASPMVQALEMSMPEAGIGVLSFDFPAHGDSPVWDLHETWCIDDLETVENYVRELAPEAEIEYFGSSFGAFTLLNYLSARPHAGKRAMLRSAAVAMGRLAESWADEKARADMAEKGYFVPDYDYVREMRVTPVFLQELSDHDVFRTYRPGVTEVFMVHGGSDSVAAPEAAREFARRFSIRLLEIPDGEHDLMGPGQLEQVLAAAKDFFTA